MNDRRLTLMRDGLAAEFLDGVIAAERYAQTQVFHCSVSAAAIHAAPDAGSEQQDQLLFGEAFEVLSESEGFCFGQARRDGYVGYVAREALNAGVIEPTHWVRALRTIAFSKADLKSPVKLQLTMNSLVRVIGSDGKFLEVEDAGFVFADHLSPVGRYAADHVAVAEVFVGAPYLWGGRESVGLDCSGLVQQALYAAGGASPRDAYMQVETLGRPIERKHLGRGDLVFWDGHVAIMVDAKRIIHANAHHMSVEIEPLKDAEKRIKAAGAGAPTAFRRLF